MVGNPPPFGGPWEGKIRVKPRQKGKIKAEKEKLIEKIRNIIIKNLNTAIIYRILEKIVRI